MAPAVTRSLGGSASRTLKVPAVIELQSFWILETQS